MYKQIYILILFFCSLSYSCSTKNEELERADILIYTAPDSALHILKSIQSQKLHSRSDKALYALLMSQALDKNGIKVESDSLINIATSYYDDSDPLKAGYAWFYKSRCDNNRGDANKRTNSLLKANEYALLSHDDVLIGLVYTGKADLYKIQQSIDSAFVYYKKSSKYFIKAKDIYNTVICLLNLSDLYFSLNKPDSALLYLKNSEKGAKKLNDTELLSSVYRSIGRLYIFKNDLKQSLKYYRLAPTTNNRIYDSSKLLLMADIFCRMNQYDSAVYYLNKIGKEKNINSYYSKLFLKIYEAQKNYPQALYYSKRVAIVNDSLFHESLNISFAGLEKKYNYQKFQIDNQQLTIEKKQSNIFLLALFILLCLGAVAFLLWRYKIKSHQLSIQKELVFQEQQLRENEITANRLLEQQIKMQNIILLNVDQYRKNALKKPENSKGISPVGNETFYEELIACMDLEYNGISSRIINKFPELTERDILICCLLLANFDTGMIASILNVKIDSMIKQRHRLRTKLKMDNSENLIDYLRGI